MEEKLSKKEVELLKAKTRNLSVKEGSFYGLMDGFGLRHISPFAVYLDANNKQIGFLSSLSSLLGNISQLLTLRFLKKASRKKILIGSTFFQALSWLLIIIIGTFYFLKRVDSESSSNLLILAYGLVIVFGGFLSPAWSSLMRDNISRKESGKYFGKRSKIVGIVSLVSFLVGGFILDFFEGVSIFWGFTILFAFALISRLISSYMFTKHYEPSLKISNKDYFTFFDFLKRLPKSNFAKYSLFVALIMFATAIASPFFSVYMLRNLGFNYRLWTLIMVCSSAGSFLFMTYWGKFSDRHGNYISIKISSMLIPLVPLLWVFSPIILQYLGKTVLIFYLVFVEIFSGIVWAGFNLSTFNYVYDAVSRKKLVLCTIYFNILNGVGTFIGAILGGFLSSVDKLNIFGSAIIFVFLLSGILRFVVHLIFINKIKEVRKVKDSDHIEVRTFFMEKIFGASHNHINPKPAQ